MRTTLMAASLIITSSFAASAGEFRGAIVNTVAAPDANSALQVRANPRASAPALGSVRNGDPISLTGPCRQFRKNGILQRSINLNTFTSAQTQTSIHQPRVWCEVLFEPLPGKPAIGWVNAKYVNLM